MCRVTADEIGSDQQPAALSTIVRAMAVSADLADQGGERVRCRDIISRIYEVFDDLELGLAPNAESRMVAADAATWIGDNERSAALLADVSVYQASR